MMVALVLGLFIVGGAISVLLSGKQTYQASQNLAQLQENARLSFELMARSLREAGGNAYGTGYGAVNAVNERPSDDWWRSWDQGALRGYDGKTDTTVVAFGTGAGARVRETDAFVIRSGSLGQPLLIRKHVPESAVFFVNTKDHGYVDGDIVMVCDSQGSAILQVSEGSINNETIVHNEGNKVTPGNCTKFLGPPTGACTTNTKKTFAGGGFLTKLSAEFWYVGHNNRGGQSLFRRRLNGNPDNTTADEIAEGVRDLELQFLKVDETRYLPDTAWASWGAADWSTVMAVRFKLSLASTDPNSPVLQREASHTVRLRNVRASQ